MSSSNSVSVPSPAGQSRPPGMHDVARMAGVSHQTVSRVLNDHPNVRNETRARVEQAIAELGYRRNVAARALVTRRSNTIGVITSVTQLWGPSSTLVSVERAARKAGYYTSVAGLESIAPADVQEVLSYFIDQSVEGIVVIAPEATMAHMAQPFVSTIPVVMVAAGAEPAVGVQITSVNQEAGARSATRHLIDLGHTDIAHVAGPDMSFDAIARLRGWRLELRKAKVPLGRILYGDWTAASGFAAGKAMIERRLASAVFVSNDLMALGFIRALHDAGISVPDDISVVGFDDMPGAAHFIPGLTTVRQDLESLGQQCMSMLVDALAGNPSDPPPVDTELIVRQSTRPAD
jgi:DNA-binding LacI/PurR family transcriptional regulator